MIGPTCTLINCTLITKLFILGISEVGSCFHEYGRALIEIDPQLPICHRLKTWSIELPGPVGIPWYAFSNEVSHAIFYIYWRGVIVSVQPGMYQPPTPTNSKETTFTQRVFGGKKKTFFNKFETPWVAWVWQRCFWLYCAILSEL